MTKDSIIKEKNLKISENIIIEDTDEYITSRIDGSKRKRIYGRYLQSIGLTSEEYKILFPDAPLMSGDDNRSTSKNSGKHMKDEYYKKLFSEKFKGQNNPNHKCNTTKEERQIRSPFSKKFYNNEKEYNLFINKINNNKKHNTRRDFFDTDLEYKNRQTTFSYKKCIEKWGKENGQEIFTNRQIKWQETLRKNKKLKGGYSYISQELFDILNNFFSNKTFNYAKNKGEIKIRRSDKKGIWLLDFTDVDKKKVIEYNGDLYHANPKLYEKNDTPHPFRKNLKAVDIWNKDTQKYEDIKNYGYNILIIWDSEYKKNKDEIVQKCINFLNEN